MGEFDVRAACGLARRKLTAARKHLKAVPVALDGVASLFGDLDGCLESGAGNLSARVHDLVGIILSKLDEFDREMREAVNGDGA